MVAIAAGGLYSNPFIATTHRRLHALAPICHQTATALLPQDTLCAASSTLITKALHLSDEGQAHVGLCPSTGRTPSDAVNRVLGLGRELHSLAVESLGKERRGPLTSHSLR